MTLRVARPMPVWPALWTEVRVPTRLVRTPQFFRLDGGLVPTRTLGQRLWVPALTRSRELPVHPRNLQRRANSNSSRLRAARRT
jgi:hypothetical protein